MLFISPALAATHFSIDFGAENIRVAYTEDMLKTQILPDPDGKSFTKSACALKLPAYKEGHMTLEDAKNARVLIGKQAARYIKHHPESGEINIPYIIGRTGQDLKGKAAPVELLSLLLLTIFNRQECSELEDITISFPHYFTYSQRAEILAACQLAELPLAGIIEDNHAVSQYYSCLYGARFQHHSSHVIIIDVGASGVRASHNIFMYNRTKPVCHVDSAVWSENVGGFAFIKRVAESEQCTFAQAEKKLIANPSKYVDILQPELDELFKLVSKVGGEKITEVQVIGGASRYPFVIDTIKEALGGIEISRDLPITDTQVFGALYASLATRELGPFALVEQQTLPVYTMSVECGGLSHPYCTQGIRNCTSIFDIKDAYATTFDIVADETQIPKGTSPVLTKYELTNISSFQYEETDSISGLFMLEPPDPVAFATMWCVNQDRCEKIEIRQPSPKIEGEAEMVEFVGAYLEAFIKRENDRRLKDRLAAVMSKAMDQNAEELKQQIDQAQEILEKVGPIDEEEEAMIRKLIDALKNCDKKNDVDEESDMNDMEDSL